MGVRFGKLFCQLDFISLQGKELELNAKQFNAEFLKTEAFI